MGGFCDCLAEILGISGAVALAQCVKAYDICGKTKTTYRIDKSG